MIVDQLSKICMIFCCFFLKERSCCKMIMQNGPGGLFIMILALNILHFGMFGVWEHLSL